MTNIDQFESVFKAADKPVFSLEAFAVKSILVISDGDAAATSKLAEPLSRLLAPLNGTVPPETTIVAGDQFSNVKQLLSLVQQHQPDLICTQRNLHMPASDFPYSVGVFVEVLTQATDVPVLLLPVTTNAELVVQVPDRVGTVMAITDHLTGDHHLVSYAARMTPAEGTLFLTHVEDRTTYERYIATISKIPTIDTNEARESILHQLLKEPRDYIDSVSGVLAKADQAITVEPVVAVGHHVSEHRRLVEQHQVDLLVLNAKDDDQLAMHGVAYPLTIELRQIPLLLL